MARRRSNPRPLWIAGIAGVAVLLVGGIALAAGKGSGGSSCTNWSKVTDTTTAVAITNALNLNNVGPGTYYYTFQGKPVKFVNNMDGSNNVDPATPSGNTSIYLCAS